MRETNPEYITKIKEYDRERKRKARASINTSEHSLCSSSSTPEKKSNPPTYYKVLNKSKKVQEILGPSPITHTSVLKHVLKKVMRSPRKLECLKSSPFKKLHNSSFVTPPKDASVTKDLRKIAVLRSKRNEKATKKAGEIVANLKTRFKTISEIAREASDDKKAVYRLLSPPKKRIKDETKLSRKLTNEIKEEVEGMYNDEGNFLLSPRYESG